MHQPTQECGNTLALVITPHDIIIIVVFDTISDHAVVDISKLAWFIS